MLGTCWGSYKEPKSFKTVHLGFTVVYLLSIAYAEKKIDFSNVSVNRNIFLFFSTYWLHLLYFTTAGDQPGQKDQKNWLCIYALQMLSDDITGQIVKNILETAEV